MVIEAFLFPKCEDDSFHGPKCYSIDKEEKETNLRRFFCYRWSKRLLLPMRGENGERNHYRKEPLL